jgi:hypothetical protein
MPRNTDTVPYVVKHCVENADHVRIKDRQAALGKAWLAQERLAWTCRAMTSHCNHASGCAFASEKMAISSCSASLPNSSDLSVFKTYNSIPLPQSTARCRTVSYPVSSELYKRLLLYCSRSAMGQWHPDSIS